MDILHGLAIILTALCIYFLPFWIACARNHPQAWPIFWLTFFLGWSFFAWVGAFVWSVIKFRPYEADAGEWLIFGRAGDSRTEIEARGPVDLNGARAGIWHIKLSDGTRMSGWHMRGIKSGNWTVTLPDGRVLYGPMVAGLMHGRFSVDWPSGKRTEMEFRGGRQVRP